MEQLVDEALLELAHQLLGELRRTVAVVEEAHVEVGAHDVPVRAGPRLVGLFLLELLDEGTTGHHRRQAGDLVARRDVGDEVLHEGPDALDHPGHDRPHGRRSGHRQHLRRDGGEVGVEVDHVRPALGVGEVGAAMGRGDEDDVVDARRPVARRQHLLDERARGQSTAAVRDDVEDELGLGPVGLQPLQQVLGVLLGVDAEGLVVEADDGVVRRERGAQESRAVLPHARAHRSRRRSRRRCRG